MIKCVQSPADSTFSSKPERRRSTKGRPLHRSGGQIHGDYHEDYLDNDHDHDGDDEEEEEQGVNG